MSIIKILSDVYSDNPLEYIVTKLYCVPVVKALRANMSFLGLWHQTHFVGLQIDKFELSSCSRTVSFFWMLCRLKQISFLYLIILCFKVIYLKLLSSTYKTNE